MANVIKLDAEYLAERAGILKKRVDPTNKAMQLMKKALMSSGLIFQQRKRINSKIDAIRSEVNKIAQDADQLERALTNGVSRVNDWERDTRNRERTTASRLNKTWGFEVANWECGGIQGSQTVPTTPVPSNSR